MVEEPESGLVTDPSKFKHQSVEEIKKGGKREVKRLSEEEEKVKERGELVGAMAEATQLAYMGAIKETQLSESADYREFQNSERWCNTRLEIGTQLIRPEFWRKASEEEKRIYEYRAELSRAVQVKRAAGFTLEGQYKNPELGGFSKTETTALYYVPGVREAMETYVKYVDNSDSEDERFRPIRTGDEGKENPSRVSVLTIQDRDDAEQIRKQIAEKEIAPILESRLRQEYQKEEKEIDEKALKKEAMRMAIDAEQIAFNLFYIGNTFESLDAKFVEITDKKDRDYGKTVRREELGMGLMASELATPPIKFIMNPMDALVVRSARGTERLKTVGAYGEWTQKQMEDALRNARVVQKNGEPDYGAITEVEIVPTGSGEEKDKWWTAKRYERKVEKKNEQTGKKEKVTERGVRLYVPDCYPTKLMKSFWEETKMTSKEGKKSLLQFLRDEEEIPWKNSEAAGMWTDYMGSIRAVDSIWQYYKGENKIAFKKFGAFTEWRDGIERPLAEFGWYGDEAMKRWLFYSSWGVNRNSRMPIITMTNYQKDVIKYSLGEKNLNYLPEKQVFFEWDKSTGQRLAEKTGLPI